MTRAERTAVASLLCLPVMTLVAIAWLVVSRPGSLAAMFPPLGMALTPLTGLALGVVAIRRGGGALAIVATVLSVVVNPAIAAGVIAYGALAIWFWMALAQSHAL